MESEKLKETEKVRKLWEVRKKGRDWEREWKGRSHGTKKLYACKMERS